MITLKKLHIKGVYLITIEDKFMVLFNRDKTNVADNERKAMFTIFAGNYDLYSKVDSLYDFKNHRIKDDCFSKVDLSSGARQLVKLAFNLYNSGNEANVMDIFSSLDEYNYDLAIKAIHVRFNRVSPV